MPQYHFNLEEDEEDEEDEELDDNLNDDETKMNTLQNNAFGQETFVPVDKTQIKHNVSNTLPRMIVSETGAKSNAGEMVDLQDFSIKYPKSVRIASSNGNNNNNNGYSTIRRPQSGTILGTESIMTLPRLGQPIISTLGRSHCHYHHRQIQPHSPQQQQYQTQNNQWVKPAPLTHSVATLNTNRSSSSSISPSGTIIVKPKGILRDTTFGTNGTSGHSGTEQSIMPNQSLVTINEQQQSKSPSNHPTVSFNIDNKTNSQEISLDDNDLALSIVPPPTPALPAAMASLAQQSSFILSTPIHYSMAPNTMPNTIGPDTILTNTTIPVMTSGSFNVFRCPKFPVNDPLLSNTTGTPAIINTMAKMPMSFTNDTNIPVSMVNINQPTAQLSHLPNTTTTIAIIEHDNSGNCSSPMTEPAVSYPLESNIQLSSSIGNFLV